MENQAPIRWHSYNRFYFSMLTGILLIALAVAIGLDGIFLSLFLLCCGIFIVGVSIVVIAQKGVWVEVSDTGIVYRNIFGIRNIDWEEVSYSYTITIKLLEIVHVKKTDGKSVTLPISGSKARDLAEKINKFKNET
ncbi:PH domain-containing protein [Pseudoalteromonas pernae]|uniref:PH domain-containing protein n=1 Tax=Pseudoalteromonas pernae TaxID=3118054 RepID=UPI0032429D1B